MGNTKAPRTAAEERIHELFKSRIPHNGTEQERRPWRGLMIGIRILKIATLKQSSAGYRSVSECSKIGVLSSILVSTSSTLSSTLISALSSILDSILGRMSSTLSSVLGSTLKIRLCLCVWTVEVKYDQANMFVSRTVFRSQSMHRSPVISTTARHSTAYPKSILMVCLLWQILHL